MFTSFLFATYKLLLMIKIKLEIDRKEYPLDNVNYSFVPSLLENIIASDTISLGIKGNKVDQSLLDWC